EGGRGAVRRQMDLLERGAEQPLDSVRRGQDQRDVGLGLVLYAERIIAPGQRAGRQYGNRNVSQSHQKPSDVRGAVAARMERPRAPSFTWNARPQNEVENWSVTVRRF